MKIINFLFLHVPLLLVLLMCTFFIFWCWFHQGSCKDSENASEYIKLYNFGPSKKDTGSLFSGHTVTINYHLKKWNKAPFLLLTRTWSWCGGQGYNPIWKFLAKWRKSLNTLNNTLHFPTAKAWLLCMSGTTDFTIRWWLQIHLQKYFPFFHIWIGSTHSDTNFCHAGPLVI